MNILLLSCPNSQFEKVYPLNLGIISSILKREGHRVFGIDLSFAPIRNCVQLIKENDIDIIGISMSYHNSKIACAAVNTIKSKTSLPIIALGSYPTIKGDELIRACCTTIDYLIKGEPEQTFLELVQTIGQNHDVREVEGLIWRNGHEIVQNTERKHMPNLDELPFADRSLFPIKNYCGMICKNRQYTQIVTSRGCPHECSYCFQNLNEPQIRQRTPENVVDEMEYLVKNYKIKEIHIEDANFVSGNCKRVKAICQEILNRKLRVDWQCPGVIPISEITDMPMLDLMAQAGCYNISIGVESFDLSVTKWVKRNQTTEALPRILQKCRKNNMEVSCHMMIGFPGQTRCQIEDDIQLSRTYPFDFIHYNIFQELPGVSAKENITIDLTDSVLKKIQRSAYRALIFKQSVMKFVLRRFLKLHNSAFMFRKMLHYLFITPDFYLVR